MTNGSPAEAANIEPVSSTPEPAPVASRSLPSGTVTFAFTDIEGSTRRWDRGRAAMQAAVRRHDELMLAAIAAYDGYVFKTVGDEFCAAFARAEDAVAAMLAAQRALAAEDFSAVDGLSVGAALHTGTADERNGDYFGPAVNRVARLLETGYGGQILVSGATADLVQGDLPPEASLRDLGEHRLRDLARPEYVYQLLAPDLRAEFPGLRSLDAHPHNLPLQFTSLIGREAQIAEITELVERHRLVTIAGSGGVGKTRISLQVAANLLDGSGDGVWFVELAPLSNGEYIPTTVAQAMGLTLAAEGAPLANLTHALRAKKTLLVFDNCEHLVEPAANVIASILRVCPDVKVLASSRQRLGIAAEETYSLPSLDIAQAITLFVERARSVDNRFATGESEAAVADICRRLDGIPLAIELAAARVRILSPQQLRERLDQRFRVLTGGSRDALPRQQTLRALIDWSHDLLDERERTLFRRLAIFVDGFTLEGAVVVGRADGLDEADTFDVLASLVDKSLVLAEPDGDALRYRLLESTRVYALEKLDAADERAELAGRHLRYLRDHFAQLRTRAERTARLTELEQALRTELEGVRSAVDGARSRADVIEGAELLAAIGISWRFLGLDAECIARCEQCLASLPAAESLLRAQLSTVLSDRFGHKGRKTRALELATEAVAYARASGDGPALVAALSRYAASIVLVNQLDGVESALGEAEAIAEVPPSLRLELLSTRALVSAMRGDEEMETAVQLYEQLRRECRALGSAHLELRAAIGLAEVEHARGWTQRAIEIAQEILPALRCGTDNVALANVLHNLAGYLVAVDDLSGACAVAREAMAINATTEPGSVQIAIEIEHLALVFALRGDLARAARLESYVEAAFGRHGFEREYTETTSRDRILSLLQEQIAGDERARLRAEGAALAPEAAIALALDHREP